MMLSFPEGQHRMEATSRPCYGFGLLSTCPLNFMDNGENDEFYDSAIFNVKSRSPIHDTVYGNIIVPKNVTFLKTMNTKLLKSVSLSMQNEASLSVKNTYMSWIQACLIDTESALSNAGTSWTQKPMANYRNDYALYSKLSPQL